MEHHGRQGDDSPRVPGCVLGLCEDDHDGGASSTGEAASASPHVRTLAVVTLLLALCGCQWGPPPRIPYVDGTTYVDRVAWLTMGCPESNQLGPTVVHVDATSGKGGWTRSLGRQYLFFAVGFLGDAVVITGWQGPVWVVPEDGPITQVPHLQHAIDVHGSLVAGDRGVVDAAAGELLWHDRHTGLASVSPHGRLIVGALRGDNVVLEARTGRVVALLPRRLYPITWEDERHLLAVAYGGRHQAMVRVGLDGRAELVGPVVDDTPYRYTFETQP
jgi:hypothetical protein